MLAFPEVNNIKASYIKHISKSNAMQNVLKFLESN